MTNSAVAKIQTSL